MSSPSSAAQAPIQMKSVVVKIPQYVLVPPDEYSAKSNRITGPHGKKLDPLYQRYKEYIRAINEQLKD